MIKEIDRSTAESSRREPHRRETPGLGFVREHVEEALRPDARESTG
jgi:hypothetical protein